MNEQLSFLKEQSECLRYIFEHVKLIDLQIKEFKQKLQANKTRLNPKYHLLSIQNSLDQLSILITEFNKSEFDNIKKEKLEDNLVQMMYAVEHKRRKLEEVK